MAPGETRVAHVVVEPAQQAPPKAERSVDYKVTLKDLKKKLVPALDDGESLAMAVGAGCEFGQGAAVLDLLSDHRMPHGSLS